MIRNDQKFEGDIKTNYKDSTPFWPEEEKPSGPNIIYILLDDTGFSDVGCFGSLIETPNIDALASDGLSYRNFHVNPMCSPTRASLLSGCYQHACGMGWLADFDIGFPGYQGCVKKECGLISETLVEKGYATFAVGKWHLAPFTHITGAGPFDQWPLGRGFEKYYGFLSAETDQYYPQLACGNEFVEQPKLPEEGYHLSEDIVDHAIRYIGDLKSNAPGKPFFCHVAFGGHHSPHQVPKEYVDRYRGKFDEGWDVYRQKVFERQKARGIIPENTVLSQSEFLVKPWDSYSKEDQKILARFMEVYAGFVSHTDAQIGRLVDYLKKIGQYNNTMIMYMHDNGASAEGGEFGTKHDMYRVLTEEEPPKPTKEDLEALGSAKSAPHYNPGWAHACNTPYRLYKTWSHCGGMKTPLIVTYPDRIKDKGAIRNQYHHVVDINETVLDVCSITQPKTVKGVVQQPKNGVSMAYSFDNPEEPGHRHIQYYEMLGNRGIWADGWKAVTDHVANPGLDFSKDVWELYNTDEDYAEANNLAAQHPEKLRELQDLWWQEAGKYNVLPLLESMFKKIPGFHSRVFKQKPEAVATHKTFYREVTGGGGPGKWQYKPFRATATVDYRKGDEGVIFSHGARNCGYAMYILRGRLVFHYNWINFKTFHIESDVELPEGSLELTLNSTDIGDGKLLSTLLINGKPCGSTVLDIAGPKFVGGSFFIGRFAVVAPSEELLDKGIFTYPNRIEKVDFDFDDILSEQEILQMMKMTAAIE